MAKVVSVMLAALGAVGSLAYWAYRQAMRPMKENKTDLKEARREIGGRLEAHDSRIGVLESESSTHKEMLEILAGQVRRQEERSENGMRRLEDSVNRVHERLNGALDNR